MLPVQFPYIISCVISIPASRRLAQGIVAAWKRSAGSKIGCGIMEVEQDDPQTAIRDWPFSYILVEKSLQECYLKRGCNGLAAHPLSLRDSNGNRMIRGMEKARRRRKSRLQKRHGLYDGTVEAKEHDGWVQKTTCG